jgi:hypothetical protein
VNDRKQLRAAARRAAWSALPALAALALAALSLAEEANPTEPSALTSREQLRLLYTVNNLGYTDTCG